MKTIRIFIIAAFIPTMLFSEESALPDTPVETPPGYATEEASKKSQDVTVNGAGITFIILAVGGILIAALQGGGSIAH